MAVITRHELKTWPEPFQAILEGKKKFEYRLNDRDYQVGDELILKEFRPNEKNPNASRYTGRVLRAVVTYILKDAFGVPNGFVVMSLDDIVHVGIW